MNSQVDKSNNVAENRHTKSDNVSKKKRKKCASIYNLYSKHLLLFFNGKTAFLIAISKLSYNDLILMLMISYFYLLRA